MSANVVDATHTANIARTPVPQCNGLGSRHTKTNAIYRTSNKPAISRRREKNLFFILLFFITFHMS